MKSMVEDDRINKRPRRVVYHDFLPPLQGGCNINITQAKAWAMLPWRFRPRGVPNKKFSINVTAKQAWGRDCGQPYFTPEHALRPPRRGMRA
ncbi:MAG: hypothetical protein QOI53_3927 [Verrucomicrobiota bacterium]|nr:hypothetical protein [Verrucomicrobiota bacterium]